MGRIHPIKGLDRLIEVFSEIRSRRTDCTLVIVGPDFGAQRSLEAMARRLGTENHIVFTGPIYGDDKFRALSSADVFVLPSRYESFGMTILEAMTASVPIIITPGCRLAGELENSGAALVASTNGELLEAIERCLEDDDLCAQLKSQAERLLHEKFGSARVLNQLEYVYSEAVAA